ncbi:uncharacterized protein [Haliotis cracherodii]|uniref:uncharacterized protein n=1 Tax=Haliotis cracherodii TaxID=6455 RepID=UPI0039EB85C5
MATMRMMFDFVPVNTLPTNYITVTKVDSLLDCTHECVRQSTCGAIAFNTIYLACYLYQGSIQADPLPTTGMDLLVYNLQEGTGCGGAIGPLLGPGYPKCPTVSGYSYEPALNVCYKRLSSNNLAGKATCIQEGGSDLLKIDTQEKQDFFEPLVPATEYTYIQGNYNPITREWAYWDEGTTKLMPFIEWAPYQPNGATTGQNCMAFDMMGQHDSPCSHWSYFLCEYYMK